MGYSYSSFKKHASWGVLLVTGCGVSVTVCADESDAASDMQQNRPADYSPEITAVSNHTDNSLHRILLSEEHQVATSKMRRRAPSAEELKSLHKGLRENINQAYGQSAIHTAK